MPGKPSREGSGHSRATSSSGAALTVAVYAVIMLGGALPIPLYPLWGPDLGLGPLTTTVVFAAYVVGVVGALVLLGPMSDRSGRRPLLMIAVAIAAVSTVLVAVATDVPLLLAGRFASGVATGIATSTATAAISELLTSRQRASAVSIAANLGGIGLGTIIAGFFGQDVPDPTRSVFWTYLIALGLAALALTRIPETVAPRAPLRIAPQRPALSPRPERAQFVGAAVIAAAAFGVNGFFSSLAPEFLRDQLHITDLAAIGLLVSLLFAAALAAQLAVPPAGVRKATPGVAVLVIGVGVLLIALRSASLPAFVIATVLTGSGVGLTVRRGLIITETYAEPGRRADLGATYFLIAYLGLVAPTLTLGVLDQVAGQGLSIAVLTAIVIATAFAGLTLARSRPSSPTDSEGDAR